MLQQHLSRLWFLGKGCKQVPPDVCGGKILWAHPDGYFLSAGGYKVLHTFGPAMRIKGKKCNNGSRGLRHPNMRKYGNASCHRLMAYAFAEQPCPTFIGKNGKPYKGIVHHLIEDPYDYKPANLLFWLSRAEHGEAVRRQRALRKCVPDLHVFTCDRLRELQDPRITSRDDFERQLAAIQRRGYHFVNL